MKNYLIFGGTTESVLLAKHFIEQGAQVTVSVATEYGALMLKGLPLSIQTGRLDIHQMCELIEKNDFSDIFDVTHPYADEVTKNIKEAARLSGKHYVRVLRPDVSLNSDFLSVSDAEEAEKILEKLDGNILLTTGSKDLSIFAKLPDYQNRVWVRILASEASLHQAISLGYPPNHIIAMHGPFSTELNLAILRQCSIRVLVTKRSGAAGGFQEKADAAQQAGVQLLVLERPGKEQGISIEQAIETYR